MNPLLTPPSELKDELVDVTWFGQGHLEYMVAFDSREGAIAHARLLYIKDQITIDEFESYVAAVLKGAT